VTSATFTSAEGAPIATWVAGDAPALLPAGIGMPVAAPIHVRLQRRAIADYEKPSAPKPSTLRLLPLADPPASRARVEQTTCGTPRTGRTADALAVRPLLDDHASARLWIERPGAPQVVVGWFRDAERLYPRTYWLARPAELTPESRVVSDAGCLVELTLAPR